MFVFPLVARVTESTKPTPPLARTTRFERTAADGGVRIGVSVFVIAFMAFSVRRLYLSIKDCGPKVTDFLS